ncbi:MAG: DUF4286 family protein [Ignavibacteriaceae bacterium]
MVLYVVNTTIKKHLQGEWLKWMKETHIPNVIATGYLTKAEIYTVILPQKGGDEITFSVQYYSDSYEKFMAYSVKESKRLQKEHTDKFGDYISEERFVFEKS